MLLRRLVVVIASVFFSSSPTHAADANGDPLVVYSAGSMNGALAAALKSYSAESGKEVLLSSGPAGKMLDKIEAGDRVDVFVSANMAHPRRLTAEHKATATVVVARNRICIAARRDLGVTSANLLDKLLDPKVRLGTSTPKADPGGDYAWELFDKAGRIRPGATEVLKGKAQQVVGGGASQKMALPASALDALDRYKVDVMVGYCSGRKTKRDESVDHVELPHELGIPVDYGLTVLTTSPDAARREAADRLALYLMSPVAQATMAEYGFVPVTSSTAP